MKLLVMTPFFSSEGYEDKWNINYDPQGGMQLMISRLCLAIEKQFEDVNIDVITMGQPCIPKERMYSKNIKVYSYRIPILKIKSKLGGYCGLIKSWALSTFFHIRLLKNKKYDAIFAHADGSGSALLLYHLMQKILKIPLYLQIHSSRGATQSSTTFWEKVTNRLAIRMEIKTVLSATWVYTLSAQTSQYYEKNIGSIKNVKKIIFLPDLNLFLNFDKNKIVERKIKKQSKFLLLYLGRVSSEKGCNVFLDLAKILDSNIYHIVFCGDGPELKRIKMQVKKDMTEHMFTFLGFIDHEIVPQIISECDVGIVPSDYEELGIVIWEVMALRKPIIAHNLATVKQIIENEKDGLLVKKGEIQEMHNAIKRLYLDINLRNYLVENAFKKAEKVSVIGDVAKLVMQDIKEEINYD